MTVNGVWKLLDNEAVCAKTFIESEPWLEVDLEALHHIRSVVPLGRQAIPDDRECTADTHSHDRFSTIRLLNRSRPRGQPLQYRLAPYWIMLSKTPILASDIIDARQASVYSYKVGPMQEQDHQFDYLLIAHYISDCCSVRSAEMSLRSTLMCLKISVYDS